MLADFTRTQRRSDVDDVDDDISTFNHWKNKILWRKVSMSCDHLLNDFFIVIVRTIWYLERKRDCISSIDEHIQLAAVNWCCFFYSILKSRIFFYLRNCRISYPYLSILIILLLLIPVIDNKFHWYKICPLIFDARILSSSLKVNILIKLISVESLYRWRWFIFRLILFSVLPNAIYRITSILSKTPFTRRRFVSYKKKRFCFKNKLCMFFCTLIKWFFKRYLNFVVILRWIHRDVKQKSVQNAV